MKYEATAKVEFMRSHRDECACCQGQHIHSMSADIEGFNVEKPNHGRDIKRWLFDTVPLRDLENKTLKITVEVDEYTTCDNSGTSECKACEDKRLKAGAQ